VNRYDAVIFDYGNTLVSYWSREEWPVLLDAAIAEVSDYLRERGRLRARPDEIALRVKAERVEDGDNRVRPMEGRLRRIFELADHDLEGGAALEMCRRFLKPMFARGRRCDDVLPALQAVRERGLITGILSNLPWGSPSEPWRDEFARFDLLDAVNDVAFCRDCGWRKPARQAFDFILGKLGVTPDRCLFIGDDPRWDIAGPEAIGMDCLLIDRTGANPDAIHDLNDVLLKT
jgi:putative hydrolase of the HAD superfamily